MREHAEQLVEAYADLILRLSYTYLKSTHDAQDICQDVLLKLLTTQTRFESPEHERAWVIRVTINACKNHLASAPRTRIVALDEAQAMASPDTLGDALDDGGSDVLAAVNQLSADQREAVFLHYYEGYRIADIAKLTGKSEAAVAKSLSRARGKLRTILEGDDDGFHVQRRIG